MPLYVCTLPHDDDLLNPPIFPTSAPVSYRYIQIGARPIMPVCTLQLLVLTTPLPTFLSTLSTSSFPQPLFVAKVIRWIITPTNLSVTPLLTQSPSWDLLLVFLGPTGLSPSLKKYVRAAWTVQTGVPSRLVGNFAATNHSLLHPAPGDVPPLTGAAQKAPVTTSGQDLELSGELKQWIQSGEGREVEGAVSMLNLLAFKPGKKEEYLEYGKAFTESVGVRHGGRAKIVGNVIACEEEGWDEVAIAHYPSLEHFADMLASEDYQEANHRWRVGSLRDTFILCTSELGLPVQEKGKAKL